MTTHVYRYQSIGLNVQEVNSQIDPAFPATASPIIPPAFIDLTADDSTKPDLDATMSDLGWIYVSTDPVTTPDAVSQVTTEQVIVLASVAGKNNYTIPVGNMFLDAAGESFLDLDTGAGFVPQAFGADYSHFRRNAPGTPTSVADAAIGFSMTNAVSTGWLFRFRWKQRSIIVEPPAIAKVLSSLDYSLFWQSNSSNAPDGIRVPPMNGMQVEFWRESPRDGGKRGSADPTKIRREGRRYLPYFRGATDVFVFDRSTFAIATNRRFKYRVCYYDPTTGARSALSNDIVLVCNQSQADRVNGRVVRTARSVWVQ